jgi:epoxyqueuosine reductase
MTMSKKMKLLIHICCAPCLAAPLAHLKCEGNFHLHGFWYNPNIHPYLENRRRLETLQLFAEKEALPLIIKDEYKLEEFLQGVVFRESVRCRFCYYDRLHYAAIVAAKGKFEYFTSTLLYSKYQNHDLIREIGETCAREQGVKFLYRDFREFWKEGICLSKTADMYRQQYCGCIYSEKERYFPDKKGDKL